MTDAEPEESDRQLDDSAGNRRWPLRLVLWIYAKVGADPTEPEGYGGRWPTTRQAFLWDLLPDEPAPRRDGVVQPQWSAPLWVDQLDEADVDAALADERQAHRDEIATVAGIEGKASRLLTPTVTLLAGTIALAAFELKAAADSRTGGGAVVPAVGAGFASVGALWLFIAIIRAMDADTRMGVYSPWTPELRLRGKRAMLAHEALGGHLASWTAKQKAQRLMWARAAVSRAVVVLTIALVLGGVTILTRSSAPTTLPTPGSCRCHTPLPQVPAGTATTSPTSGPTPPQKTARPSPTPT